MATKTRKHLPETPVDPDAALPGPFTVRDYETKEGDFWIDSENWSGEWLTPRSRGRSTLGGTIATVHQRGAGGFNVKKTAQVFAAAPELLAALEGWAEWAANRDVPFELISKTRLAIAAARGGKGGAA